MISPLISIKKRTEKGFLDHIYMHHTYNTIYSKNVERICLSWFPIYTPTMLLRFVWGWWWVSGSLTTHTTQRKSTLVTEEAHARNTFNIMPSFNLNRTWKLNMCIVRDATILNKYMLHTLGTNYCDSFIYAFELYTNTQIPYTFMHKVTFEHYNYILSAVYMYENNICRHCSTLLDDGYIHRKFTKKKGI